MNFFKRVTLLLSFALSFILSSSLTQALETDDFYALGASIPDSRKAVNDYVNNIIDKHVLKSNKKRRSTSCDKLTLRIAGKLLTRFRGPVNLLERKGLLYPDTDGRDEIYEDTIYRDIAVLKSQSRHVRVGQIVFGEDKFEHFFGLGFVHYVQYRICLLYTSPSPRD